MMLVVVQTVPSSHTGTLIFGSPAPVCIGSGIFAVFFAAQCLYVEYELMIKGKRKELAVNNFLTLRLFKLWRGACSNIGDVLEARLWMLGLFSLRKREILR